MPDDLSTIFDKLAFASMTTKQRVERIVDDLLRTRRRYAFRSVDNGLYPLPEFASVGRKRVMEHIEMLVRVHGSLGVSRVRLASMVMKRILSVENREAQALWKEYRKKHRDH